MVDSTVLVTYTVVVNWRRHRLQLQPAGQLRSTVSGTLTVPEHRTDYTARPLTTARTAAIFIQAPAQDPHNCSSITSALIAVVCLVHTVVRRCCDTYCEFKCPNSTQLNSTHHAETMSNWSVSVEHRFGKSQVATGEEYNDPTRSVDGVLISLTIGLEPVSG